PLTNPPQQVKECDTLTFTVQATDPNPSNTVTLGVSGLPTGATFTPIPPSPARTVRSTFSWRPVAAQPGRYVVTFTAVNTRGASAKPHKVNITVVPNRPPVFEIPPSPDPSVVLEVFTAHILSFPVQARDPDTGDLVTLGIQSRPIGSRFDIPAPSNPARS